ncbi:MAG TPA: hypothetical protein VI197_14095 [Polyangiaceae bacterium]
MLRRVLWLLPTLFLVSLAAFQFLAWTLPTPVQRYRGELPRSAPLPVFVNLHPDNARELALRLMRRVSEGRDQRAAEQLAKLGGAALPHILPRFDQLSPTERGRVALALKPLAVRMGVATHLELGDPDAASLFWTRFWQDRELDFRPIVVRRLVKRLTERSLTLRRDDVIQLDTYALPELVQALGRVRDRADVERVRRLGLLLAHITQKDWHLGADPSVSDARRLVAIWQDWWLSEGPNYVALDGISKAIATVTQTRYGAWLRGLPSGFAARGGTPALARSLPHATLLTLLLVASGAFGGYLLGAAAAVVGVARQGRTSRLLGVTAFLGLLVPCLVPTLKAGGKGGLFAAALLMIAFGYGAAYLYQRAATLSRRGAPWWPQRTATAASMLAVLRESAGAAVGLLAGSLPALFVAATVLETAFDLPGLGQSTVHAVRLGDAEWLMVCALVSAAITALLQTLSDSLAAALGYRPSVGANPLALENMR